MNVGDRFQKEIVTMIPSTTARHVQSKLKKELNRTVVLEKKKRPQGMG